jgi:hypothetical protein
LGGGHPGQSGKKDAPDNWLRDSHDFSNFWFKVQGSRFKVQDSKSSLELEEAKIAGSGRAPARSNLVGSLFSL